MIIRCDNVMSFKLSLNLGINIISIHKVHTSFIHLLEKQHSVSIPSVKTLFYSPQPIIDEGVVM